MVKGGHTRRQGGGQSAAGTDRDAPCRRRLLEIGRVTRCAPFQPSLEGDDRSRFAPYLRLLDTRQLANRADRGKPGRPQQFRRRSGNLRTRG